MYLNPTAYVRHQDLRKFPFLSARIWSNRNLGREARPGATRECSKYVVSTITSEDDDMQGMVEIDLLHNMLAFS